MKYNPDTYQEAISKIEEAIRKIEGIQPEVIIGASEAFPSTDSVYIKELHQEMIVLQQITMKNRVIFNKTKAIIEYAKTNLVEVEEEFQSKIAEVIG